MPRAFWFSSPSTAYQPVAQHEKDCDADADADSTADVLEAQAAEPAPAPTASTGSPLGTALLCIAAANLLLAAAALFLTRDLAGLRVPVFGMDLADLPRPNPYVGLNL
ncbi:hypothetical protein GGX14DRAFT_401252 [Mycena pura]|uniref:Uncharacterized protein n=1 Tax=Mycena pura TaxID=153505 RepID=A0AAD6V0N5_9AGAR|nr:hypothetical protein GGX14DRAFT_401252 [Mycena pura]